MSDDNVSAAELVDDLHSKQRSLSKIGMTAGQIPTSSQAKGLGDRQQWTTPDGKRFIGSGATVKELIPGFYDIDAVQGVGIVFEKLPLKEEEMIYFPDTNSDVIINELKNFWEREDLFAQFKIAFKRGMLMYGPQGSGKTTTINQILKDLIERGGVAIKFGIPELFIAGMKILRDIQPTVPVVVVMEDIDTIIKTVGESNVLQVLDGAENIDRVVFLATTNYPEMLPPRIVNRPSRFDRRFQIPHPTSGNRRLYLETLFARGGGAAPKDLEKWVSSTADFSMAHLKELFVGVVCLGRDFDEVIDTLYKMMKKKISSDQDGGKVAGKMGFFESPADFGDEGGD